MTDRPQISIITPTYQHAAYIVPCLQSVRSQTFSDWEMIVVDDGSTDGTQAILETISDPRIRFIRQEHKGANRLGETYNTALAAAQGEFVAILEGDDWWPKDALEKRHSALRGKNAVLAHGNALWHYTSSQGRTREILWRPADQFEFSVLQNKPAGESLKAFLAGENIISSQTVLIRRSALDKIGGFWKGGYLPLVDLPTWLELARVGEFVYVDSVLGYWRRHPQSITMSRDQQKAHSLGLERCLEEYRARHGLSTGAAPGRDLAKRWERSWIEPILHSADVYLGLEDYVLAEKIYRGSWPHARTLVQKIWIVLGRLSCRFRTDLCAPVKRFHRLLKKGSD